MPVDKSSVPQVQQFFRKGVQSKASKIQKIKQFRIFLSYKVYFVVQGKFSNFCG